MSTSEREKMAAGQWYSCIDPELEALRARARAAVHEHNTLAPGERGNMGPALAARTGLVAARPGVERRAVRRGVGRGVGGGRAHLVASSRGPPYPKPIRIDASSSSVTIRSKMKPRSHFADRAPTRWIVVPSQRGSAGSVLSQ